MLENLNMKTTFTSILNLIWKVGLGIVGLAVVAVGIILGIAWYQGTYGRSYWGDKTLKDEIIVESYYDRTVRVKNQKTGHYTTEKIRWVSDVPRRDSLTVYCDTEGKRGFLNVNTGEIAIRAQYRKAWQFSEGLGAVLGDNDNIGFINSDNQLVIDCMIPFEKGMDYIFKDGFCIAAFWEIDQYRYAVYAKDGSQVLGWNYTRIDEPDSKGYRIVANEDGYWLFDRYFNPVLPDRYDNIEVAQGNEGIYVTKNHVKQLLDFDGTVIDPFIIDNTYMLSYLKEYNSYDTEEYELISDIVVYQVDNWEGLMDAHTGKIITPALYWSFEMISKDLIRARLGYSDECVVLDRRGRRIEQ